MKSDEFNKIDCLGIQTDLEDKTSVKSYSDTFSLPESSTVIDTQKQISEISVTASSSTDKDLYKIPRRYKKRILLIND